MILAFIDQPRADGHTVESICGVLRQQGCQIAARTYRSWARPGRKVTGCFADPCFSRYVSARRHESGPAGSHLPGEWSTWAD